MSEPVSILPIGYALQYGVVDDAVWPDTLTEAE